MSVSNQWLRQRFPARWLFTGILLLMPTLTVSFGTVNTIGQMAEHERITRAALACLPLPPGITLQGSNADCFEPRSLAQLAGDNAFLGAVGAPDFPSPFQGPEDHCDDADFFSAPSYPRTRAGATSALEGCVLNLQSKFVGGIKAADGLLDVNNRIKRGEVDLVTGNCNNRLSIPGRAKCNVIEGFGRALHGVQDFYSHSNWVDVVPGPYSVENPPGLGQSAPAPVLDLRRLAIFAATQWSVPPNLSTGCYGGVGQDETPGVGPCKGRVTHHTLNKDEGFIDPDSGRTGTPSTSRGQITVDSTTNFARAVEGAIVETQYQWSVFRDELRAMYGSMRGNLMICAITRDDPLRACQGRNIAIVIDSSGSNQETDPSDLRIAAAEEFTRSLVTYAQANADTSPPDNVLVIDFDDSARVVYPLGDPAGATFDGIDSSGGTFIAGGIALAIDELTKGSTDSSANDHVGIVVLTDGQDENQDALVDQVNRAQSLGIRVAVGFLSPPDLGSLLSRRDVTDLPVPFLTAILKTGGFFSTIDSARAQRSFIDQVFARGVTRINDGSPSVSGGLLFPDTTLTGLISSALKPGVFTYRAAVGEQLTIKIQSLSKQTLDSTLRDVRGAVDLSHAVTDSQGVATIMYTVPPPREVELELVVKTSNPDEGVYTVGLNVTSPCNCAGNTNHDVIVGGDAGLIFTPNQITARPGDTISFSFRAKNHSVTQSSLDKPCERIVQSNGQYGFDSGFFPVSPSVRTKFPTYKLTVNDTRPIWAYCRQGPPFSHSHCAAGMVFAVNAPPNTFETFLANAIQGANPVCTTVKLTTTLYTTATTVACSTPVLGPTPTCRTLPVVLTTIRDGTPTLTTIVTVACTTPPPSLCRTLPVVLTTTRDGTPTLTTIVTVACTTPPPSLSCITFPITVAGTPTSSLVLTTSCATPTPALSCTTVPIVETTIVRGSPSITSVLTTFCAPTMPPVCRTVYTVLSTKLVTTSTFCHTTTTSLVTAPAPVSVTPTLTSTQATGSGYHYAGTGVNKVPGALDVDVQTSLFDRSNKYFGTFVTLICVILVQGLVICGATVWFCCVHKRNDHRRGEDVDFVRRWALWPSRYGYTQPGEYNAPPGVTQPEKS